MKNPLAGAIFAALAACCTAASAQDHVTLYGRLNASMEYSDASTASDGTKLGGTGRLTNNRSVFGMRGEEALYGSLKAIWQIESNISLDTGSGQLASRNTRVGLAGSAGSFFMGNWTTAYLEATSSYDPFYPTTAGYMALIGNGSTPTSDNIQDTSAFDRRQKNSLHYRSPKWNGFSGGVTWGVNEERTTVPRNPSLWSFAGAYDNGPLNVVLAYERHNNYQTAGRDDEGMKIGLSYQFPTTKVSAIYERLHYRTATGDLKRDAYYASVVQKLWTGSLRAGVGFAGNGRGNATETVGFFRSGPDTGAVQATLGYEYPLSKRTSVFGFYSRIFNKKNATYDFAINELGISAGADPQTFALGMRHVF